ncbi:UNVERIFIED_CONTAM: hypothetical protein Slati_1901400 [Sesamum latifolium]|uniref:Uncharacterized protein n=1 Tax=Sesamum latifolium TaxID=2727402 RepID=A0AAW2X634_9LAMI
MVPFRSHFIILILLLITAFTSFSPAITDAAAHGRDGRAWMNHGAFRGPGDRLVSTTVEQPSEVPKLPV